jgi:hypothetical protein
MSITTVKVVPNPYCGIALDGTPQGVVGYPGTRSYVGATLDLAHSEIADGSRFYYPGWPERIYEIPLDGAIANAMLDGSLIAATQECARKVGISEDEYLAVDLALAAEKAKAEAALKAERGVAMLKDVPTAFHPKNSIDVDGKEAAPKTRTSRGDRILSGSSANPGIVLANADKE